MKKYSFTFRPYTDAPKKDMERIAKWFSDTARDIVDPEIHSLKYEPDEPRIRVTFSSDMDSDNLRTECFVMMNPDDDGNYPYMGKYYLFGDDLKY
jgi:hypothetical protein